MSKNKPITTIIYTSPSRIASSTRYCCRSMALCYSRSRKLEYCADDHYTPCPEKNGTNNVLGITLANTNI